MLISLIFNNSEYKKFDGVNFGSITKNIKWNLLSYQRQAPKLKDLELISLALTVEFMGIDSENHLFKQIPQTKVSIA